MRILILQDYLRSGGTERQSILLARAFAAAGHRTTLLTFRPGGPLTATLGEAERRSLQPFDLGLDWFAPRIVSRVAAIKPDIILGMGRMANCYVGGLQEAFPSAAVVATMRTGKPLPWLFRRSLRLVRHVIANSQEARDALVSRQLVAAEKISVIRNSLVFANLASREAPQPDSPRRSSRPASEDWAADQTLRQQFGADTHTTVLLSVAMFRPEKNQRELVEIAAELPPSLDWQLWLAGDGPTRAACEHFVAERRLGARVKFPGFHSDPTGLYAAADIAVHASASESLSNFLIEAQAHGLPAVAYSAQGIRECFVPGRTGWEIDRGDRGAFRAALVRLAAEPPKARAARAEEARSAARLAFDPARQAAAHLELFHRLTGAG